MNINETDSKSKHKTKKGDIKSVESSSVALKANKI